MKNFRYLAVDEEGKSTWGKALAQNEAALERDLRRIGLELVKSSAPRESFLSRQLSTKVPSRLLIMFYSRLSQSLEVGLPIVATLEENAKASSSPALRRIIEDLIASLEEGNSLQQSLQKFPHVFSDLEVSLIGMGEQTGVLAQSLKDLADFLEWRNGLRSTIKKASIYPAFLLVAIAAVIAVWVGYLLPQMSTLLKEMGAPLPPLTKGVFATSLFLQSNWLPVAIFLAIAFTGTYLFRKSPKGGLLFDKWFLSLPLLGHIAAQAAFNRLSRNFAIMMKTGITVDRIFENLSRGILGNRYLEGQLKVAHHHLQRGMPLSRSLERAGGFPVLLLGAVRNGERAGTLEESFVRMANFYDQGVKNAVEGLVSAIGPLMVVLLGGIFALVILSIMLPLYDTLSGVGGIY